MIKDNLKDLQSIHVGQTTQIWCFAIVCNFLLFKLQLRVCIALSDYAELDLKLYLRGHIPKVISS
jgi:hypothetical protein